MTPYITGPNPEPTHSQRTYQTGCFAFYNNSVLSSPTMATLHSLPPELIRRVYELARPDDMENLAQSSKYIRSMSGAFLRQHRALIRKYKTLTTYEQPRAVGCILKDVLHDPIMARYIKVLDLEPHEMYFPSVGPQIEYSGEDIAQFRTAAARIGLPNNEHPRFFKANEPMLLAILMTCLPNLSSITLISSTLRCSGLYGFMEAGPSTMKPFLPNLRSVFVKHDSTEYNIMCCNLPCLQVLAAIPSVRTITAPEAQHETSDRMNYLIRPKASNVTHLNLLETAISSRLLFEVLRGFTSLESLRYSSQYTDKPTRCPFLIRSGLAVAASRSLRFLTLLMPGAQTDTHMGSLREFKKLEFLETEWDCLIPYRQSPPPMPALTLPVSIKGIILHDRKNRKEPPYQKVVDYAISVKENGTAPNLGFLVFKRSKTITAEFRAAVTEQCFARGIQLNFLECSTDDLLGEDLPQTYGNRSNVSST